MPAISEHRFEVRRAERSCEKMEHGMAGVKLIVMYPRPKDIDAFERA